MGDKNGGDWNGAGGTGGAAVRLATTTTESGGTLVVLVLVATTGNRLATKLLPEATELWRRPTRTGGVTVSLVVVVVVDDWDAGS